VKQIERFEVEEANDLWQIDIMGKTYFPLIGDLDLICSLDDRNRFIPYGQWFYSKFGINLFQVMDQSFVKYGLPRGGFSLIERAILGLLTGKERRVISRC